MPAEQPIPEEFIQSPDRARDQADAEKPFRDQASELRTQAVYVENPDVKSELLLQAAFLDAQAAERSKSVAREQARQPVDKVDVAPLSDDVESTLAGMKSKFDHPVDEATVIKYQVLGIPRAILEMGGAKSPEQLVDTRKNRLALFRMWRVQGRLNDTLAQDQQLLEELQERRKLGQYDADYRTDLRLKDAIANAEWNIALINEVIHEEPLPNEAELGQRLNELNHLFSDQLEITTSLLNASLGNFNNPDIRVQIEILQKEWAGVEEEYLRESYRVDWPQEFVERVRNIHNRIYAFTKSQ